MSKVCILPPLAAMLISCSFAAVTAQRETAPVATQTQAAVALQPIRYHVTDCHLHFVDFLQHTDGIHALLAAMDRCGVDEAMLCGMPLVKQWSTAEPVQPQYYLEDDARCYWYSATDALVARELLTLKPKERARFHPFICGFNGTDRNAVEHVKRMLEWYPGLWQGIGEVMARHDDLTALTYGETAHADSTALDPVYDLATDNDMPVSIHSNIGSVWKRDPLYLHEMEDAIKRHPRTRFIWCHAGISRRIDVPAVTQEMHRLLLTYPNVWIDLSWVVFENNIAPHGKLSEDWVSLIEQFPDRFLIGSDKVGHFGDYYTEIQKYYLLLDALKPATARRVGRDNFLSLLPKRVHALPSGR